MTDNLRGLVWVVAEDNTEDVNLETAYSLDAIFVYRRRIDRRQSVPRPEYSRASHRDVLRGGCDWADFDESMWEVISEDNRPKRRIRR